MTERAVSPNQQQVGIRGRPPGNGVDPIGSWSEVHTIGRNELCIFPALEEDTEAPHNVGHQNGLNNQDVAHEVPRLAEVDLAAEIADEDAANERLQQMELEDLRAVRHILGRSILNNVITVRHYWPVLKQLRDNLPEEGSHGMSYGQEYARILERLARVMTIPSKQDYKSAHCAHPLGYEGLFKEIEEMTPDFSCPLDYGECLDRLCEDMTATFPMMRGADGVHVIKDREQYARRLRSLAALVLRSV